MFDEPTSNLDVLASRGIREFMVEARGRGKSVIFSTHVLHDAERLCDRVTIIHQVIPILNAVLALRDAIVQATVVWPALVVTTASLAATGAPSWYAALGLFTREALLIKS